MSTRVAVYTYANSISYVSDKILWSMRKLITMIGLDPINLVSEWSLLDKGLQTWLRSRHLVGATIEIYNKTRGSFVGRWDFDIDYTYNSGDDGEFTTDAQLIKNAIAKNVTDVKNCSYDIIFRNKPGYPKVPGFVSCNLRSTQGYVRQSLGTSISTNYLGAQLNYWRKI
ncbi:MAG TPA: HORMA domain containing protein [Ignavibacteria bacterium]|jgi:hypothetical protein